MPYNPDQPRDPGGQDGGRWIKGGATLDDAHVYAMIDQEVNDLAEYMAKKGDPYSPEDIAQGRAWLVEQYKRLYTRDITELQKRLKAFSDAKIKPMVTIETLYNADAVPAGAFDVTLGDSQFAPGATVWFDESGNIDIPEALDITDSDFFAGQPELAGRYADMLDAVRGETPTGVVTLHRGMAAAEADAWNSGETIKVGKFFTSDKTANFASDVPGVFPELHSFKVARRAIIQTDSGIYQLRRDAKLGSDGIIDVVGDSLPNGGVKQEFSGARIYKQPGR